MMTQLPRKYRSFFAAIVWLCLSIYTAPPALALSHYGRSCATNDDCIDCKNDLKCLACLHDCYNTYSEADTIPGQKIDREQYCKKKQAKWCSAQCWDPDDTEDEDYRLTKPQCSKPF